MTNAGYCLVLCPLSPRLHLQLWQTSSRQLVAPYLKYLSFSYFLLENFLWNVGDCFTFTPVKPGSEEMGTSFSHVEGWCWWVVE